MSERSEQLLAKLEDKLGNYLLSSKLSLGDAEVKISSENMLEFFRLLKLDSELAFNLFLNVTAVDWLDDRDDRFELVYHLLSTTKLHRLRIKIDVPETNPKVTTVTSLWSGADYMEREVWDMYGIEFEGHQDLRRILMYDEFVGHPLRKDYPVQGKQPRVELRHPEVENTAVKMNRPELAGSGLVQIGGAKTA